jgi:hypothetical protein
MQLVFFSSSYIDCVGTTTYSYFCLQDTKIRVVLEGPPAPASPVPPLLLLLPLLAALLLLLLPLMVPCSSAE